MTAASRLGRRSARARALDRAGGGVGADGALMRRLVRRMTEAQARAWIARDRRSVAYHEAGHAVSAALLRVQYVAAVTVRHGRDHLGRTFFLPRPGKPRRRYLLALALSLYAGGAAAGIAADGDEYDYWLDPGGAIGDREKARCVLGDAGFGGASLEQAEWRQWCAAWEFCRANWPAIEAVARDLIRRSSIDGQRLSDLIWAAQQEQS